MPSSTSVHRVAVVKVSSNKLNTPNGTHVTTFDACDVDGNVIYSFALFGIEGNPVTLQIGD